MVVPARNPHAGLPFGADDATIAALLDEVSIPALMCSLVHMTGDASWMRRPERPRLISPADVQGMMSLEDQAEIRRLALPAIAAYRDGGCEPRMPSPEVIREMMAFLATRPVPESHVLMMLEEMQLDGADARSVAWGDEVPADVRETSPVVVIGCGESGIVAGIRLAEAGLPFTIVEKIDGPGGVWRHNRYPGARVDVPTHSYSYSFELSDTWSEYYVRQPELQAYFEQVVDTYGLTPHCRFDTEVTSARWDDDSARWCIETRASDGSTGTLMARFVVSAVGALSLPFLPEIPGMDSFAGPSFHSAEWPADVDHRGAHVALVGAGASGFQIAPTIADEVEHLTIFQRTRQWVIPNDLYHEPVPPGDNWAMTHLPFYGRWYRFMLMYAGIMVGTKPFRRDPGYADPGAISAGNASRREFLIGWLSGLLEGRPDLIEKSIPHYPPSGKRILQDNGSWYACLHKPNVELIQCGIDHIQPDGIVDTEGVLHRADIICFATGFRANDYLAPIEFTGRHGSSIRDQWGDEPTAYLGITVPNFPNLFLMYGPGTNLAHSASLIFHSECQTRYLIDAMHRVLSTGARSIEVKPEVNDEFALRYRAEIDQLIWAHESIEHSHYKNRAGKIYSLSPWPMDTYWAWTSAVDPDDYIIV